VGALKEVGATVLGMAAIFTYNFQISFNRLKEANCELITLSDYDSLVKQAVESRYITESDVSLIKGWRLDPSSWTGQ
jgi:orotate phosphoribosyltransferase